MPKWAEIADAVVGLGLGVVPPLVVNESVPVPHVAKAEAVVWYSEESYAAACDERDKTGKPVALVFTDPVNCVPCRQLEAGALADGRVRPILAKMVAVRVDVRTAKGQALADSFGVQSWPTVLVYRGNKFSGKLTGNVAAEAVIEAITK